MLWLLRRCRRLLAAPPPPMAADVPPAAAVIGATHHLAEQVGELVALLQKPGGAAEHAQQVRARVCRPAACKPSEGYSFLTEEMVSGIRGAFSKFDRDGEDRLSPSDTARLIEQLRLGKGAGLKIVAALGKEKGSAVASKELLDHVDKSSGEYSFASVADAKVGYGGTTWRKHANIAWISCTCLIIIASAVMIVATVYFSYILVPLMMAWFLTFLVGPIVDLLEQRPLICAGRTLCAEELQRSIPTVGRARTCCVSVDLPERSWTDAFKDLFLVARLPHSVSVFLALAIFLAGVSFIGFTFVAELVELGSDQHFQEQVKNATIWLGDKILDTTGVEVEEFSRPANVTADKDSVSVLTLLERYSGITVVVNDVVLTLLLSCFMLASREPRTLEHVRRMQEPKLMSLADEVHSMMSCEGLPFAAHSLEPHNVVGFRLQITSS